MFANNGGTFLVVRVTPITATPRTISRVQTEGEAKSQRGFDRGIIHVNSPQTARILDCTVHVLLSLTCPRCKASIQHYST